MSTSKVESKMHTSTVLGGTGQTGSVVIKTLLQQQPPVNIKIYARSREKLDTMLPGLDSHPNVTIIGGKFSDPKTAAECLRDSDTIFQCLASNYSEPGMTLVTDTANTVISTLEQIRRDSAQKTYSPPTVLMLSTCSINPDKNIMDSRLGKAFIGTALHHIYFDLQRAESRYRQTRTQSPGLLDTIFVEPGGIMPGSVPTGYELSVTKKSSHVISYADLGASMVEMAHRRDEFEWKGVSILATGVVKQNWGENAKCLGWGLFTYFLPGVWRIGRKGGYW